jgi:SOS response regulatory protein OraA/RecX
LSDGLKGKALRMLARREHSRAELARKLAADGTREDIQAVLEQLERPDRAALIEAYMEIHRVLRCNASERAAEAVLDLVAARRTAR